MGSVGQRARIWNLFLGCDVCPLITVGKCRQSFLWRVSGAEWHIITHWFHVHRSSTTKPQLMCLFSALLISKSSDSPPLSGEMEGNMNPFILSCCLLLLTLS